MSFSLFDRSSHVLFCHEPADLSFCRSSSTMQGSWSSCARWRTPCLVTTMSRWVSDSTPPALLPLIGDHRQAFSVSAYRQFLAQPQRFGLVSLAAGRIVLTHLSPGRSSWRRPAGARRGAREDNGREHRRICTARMSILRVIVPTRRLSCWAAGSLGRQCGQILHAVTSLGCPPLSTPTRSLSGGRPSTP
jgi:hypothetical protein